MKKILSAIIIISVTLIMGGSLTQKAYAASVLTISSTDPLVLAEDNLDGSALSLTMSGISFADSTLEKKNFVLTGTVPGGLSIKNISYSALDAAIVYLNYDGRKMFTSYNMGITIDGNELTPAAVYLTSINTVAINNLTHQITIVPDCAITEKNLANRYLNMSLENLAFIDSKLAIGNFTLNGAPPGCSLEAVNWISSTQAAIQLDFDGRELYANYNLSVSVANDELEDVVAPDSIISTAVVIADVPSNPVTHVTGIQLDKNKITVGVGNVYDKLIAVLIPADATNDIVHWTSQDTDVATVSDEGVVYGQTTGKTVLAVTSDDGGYADYCYVTVAETDEVQVTSIDIKENILRIKKGSTYGLQLIMEPDDASDKTVKWTSSKKSIVKVSDDGHITAVKKGKCTIKVKTTDGSNLSDACTIVVY